MTILHYPAPEDRMRPNPPGYPSIQLTPHQREISTVERVEQVSNRGMATQDFIERILEREPKLPGNSFSRGD